MHLSPKSHLHNIYTNNLRKAAQNIFTDVQDAKKEAIPTRKVMDMMRKLSSPHIELNH